MKFDCKDNKLLKVIFFHQTQVKNKLCILPPTFTVNLMRQQTIALYIFFDINHGINASLKNAIKLNSDMQGNISALIAATNLINLQLQHVKIINVNVMTKKTQTIHAICIILVHY